MKTWLGLVRVGFLLVLCFVYGFFFERNCSPFCSFPMFGIRLLSSTTTLPNPTTLFYSVMVSLKMQRNRNDVQWEHKNERNSL